MTLITCMLTGLWSGRAIELAMDRPVRGRKTLPSMPWNPCCLQHPYEGLNLFLCAYQLSKLILKSTIRPKCYRNGGERPGCILEMQNLRSTTFEACANLA